MYIKVILPMISNLQTHAEQSRAHASVYMTAANAGVRLLAALGFPAFSARSSCLKTAKLRRLALLKRL